MENLVEEAIAKFIVWGAAAAVSFWGLFRIFGERWIGSIFDKRLETFRDVQAREMEQLKFRINTLFDRATKLHQYEFEVLPEVWSKFVYAHNAVSVLVSPIQRYADLNRMNGPQLEDFLSKSTLPDHEKDEVREADNKTAAYQKRIFWHRYGECAETVRESAAYLATKGIFLRPALADKFQQLLKLLRSALIEHEMNEQHDVMPRSRDALKALEDQGEKLMHEIRIDVQKRLWPADDDDATTPPAPA